MTARKKTDTVGKAKDLFSEVIDRSMDIMQDLTMATTNASVDASLGSARRLIKFQRSGVKAGLGLVSKVQKYTEKSLRAAVKDGEWLPKEGEDVVDDWTKMMKSGLDEFTHTTDKSFGMLLHFIDRVEKEQQSKSSDKTEKSSSASTGTSSAKRATAKRKTAPTKKSSAKKKSTSSKSAK